MEDQKDNGSWAETVKHTPREAFLLVIQQYCRNIDIEKFEYYRKRAKKQYYNNSRLSAYIFTLYDRICASMDNDTNLDKKTKDRIVALINSKNTESLILGTRLMYRWLEERGLMFDENIVDVHGAMLSNDGGDFSI